jgi:hypothetical protein
MKVVVRRSAEHLISYSPQCARVTTRCKSGRSGQNGTGTGHFGECGVGWHAFDDAEQGGAARFAAQFVIVQGCTEFEQGRALAAGDFQGGVNIGLACCRVIVGLGPQSE